MTIDEARVKAKELIEQNDYEIRSCWNCNPAHEHLKSHDLILCYECGHWFYKGIDVTEGGQEEVEFSMDCIPVIGGAGEESR